MEIHDMIYESWAEVIGLFFLVSGFVLALSIQSLILNYLLIAIAGLMAGRVIFNKKNKQPLFPFILIMIACLVGYLLGSIRFNKIPILIIFAVATYASYVLHKEGHIPG